MSEKQTRCPECLTTYKVTVPQLTAAQGMVCCPKCDETFNAVSYLTSVHSEIDTSISYQFTEAEKFASDGVTQYVPTLAANVSKIFDATVENSTINLRTYLNNLNAFNPEPINTLPSINLSKDNDFILDKKNSVRYYTIWGVINFSLIAIFVIQILMVNPKTLNNNSLLNSAYIKMCTIFKCDNLIQQYSLVDLVDVKTTSINNKATNISGYIINHNEHSLTLPLIHVNLLNNNVTVHSQIYHPKEYLIKSLVNVERIPQNSPFNFNIIVPIAKKDFNDYEIQIIRP